MSMLPDDILDHRQVILVLPNMTYQVGVGFLSASKVPRHSWMSACSGLLISLPDNTGDSLAFLSPCQTIPEIEDFQHWSDGPCIPIKANQVCVVLPSKQGFQVFLNVHTSIITLFDNVRDGCLVSTMDHLKHDELKQNCTWWFQEKGV